MKESKTISQLIEDAEKNLKVCETNVEYLSHPEKYGCAFFRCDAIVLNKERMMVVNVEENGTIEPFFRWAPLNPKFYTKKIAENIVANKVFTDYEGKRIKLEIIGEKEYYKILGEWLQNRINFLKMFNQ